jgi:Na+-translocating ferredoxin:NAD+ oxidoreductase RnfE subunit
MDLLVGAIGADWQLTIFASAPLPLALYPPGAFLLAGLLFAGVKAITAKQEGAQNNTANEASLNSNNAN